MRVLMPQTIHPQIEFLGKPEMCVYLLQGKEYMIVEGGMSYLVPSMLQQFKDRQIDPSRITRLLLLHSHFDHCGIAPFFKRMIPQLKVVGSKRSQELYQKEKVVQFIRARNREMLEFLKMEKAAELNLDFDQVAVDEVVGEGDIIDLGEGLRVQIIEMPGHSSCSIAAYVESLKALFPSDAGGIPGEGEEIFPAGNENYLLYQKSLEKLRPLDVEILGAARNGAFVGKEAREFIPRSIAAAEKMRQEVIQQCQGQENLEEKIIQIAKKRYEGLKTRDIPWEVYISLIRGIIKNILQNYEKRNLKEAVSNQLSAKKLK